MLTGAGAAVDERLRSRVGSQDLEAARRTLLVLIDIGRLMLAQTEKD